MATKKSRSVAAEQARAQVGDKRRSARAGLVAGAVMERPAAPLPQAMGGEAALEGAYRLLNNRRVTPDALLAPHVAGTAERVIAAGGAFCISDTTELRFGGEARTGLGPLQGGGRGFLAHISLAVARDGSRLPFGVLGLETIIRPEQPKKRRGTRKSRTAADSESLKWSRGAIAAEEAVGGAAPLIHLMDREADIYTLFAMFIERGSRFVVRLAQDRLVTSDDAVAIRLFDALEPRNEAVVRDVPISLRKTGSKQHPSRDARLARLSIAAQTLSLHRPVHAAKVGPETLPLNFVHVFEPAPPDGCAPIDWKLVTSEPIDSPRAIEVIVDAYRTRWVIEDFNKALKTGCAFEKRELESAFALLNLFAIILPVAVQLLALRSLASANKQALASLIFSPTQLAALRSASRVPLPLNPTAEQALLAVASLGGHLKNNGAPGWQVLYRGMQDLLLLAVGRADAEAEAEM